MDLAAAEALLPTENREVTVDPIELVYLDIAPPKWGKSTFASAIPDSCLVAFERGFHFQKTPVIYINKWKEKNAQEPWADASGVVHMNMDQFVELMEVSDKYRHLSFDTANMMAKKCTDYVLMKNGWTHPTDGGDYGKGWDLAQNIPFRQVVAALMATGRGMSFITHSLVNTTNFAAGAQSKRETTLPKGIFEFLQTQADVIFHGSYGAKRPGNDYRDRIFQTQGDEETLAGNRMKDLNIPEKYVVDPVDPWGQWCTFFTDPEAAERAMEDLAQSRPALKGKGLQKKLSLKK